MVSTRSNGKKPSTVVTKEKAKKVEKPKKASKAISKAKKIDEDNEVVEEEDSKLVEQSKKIKKQPKATAKKPAKESAKKVAKEPAKESAKNPAKEPAQEPVKQLPGCGGCPEYTPEQQKLFEEKVEELSKLSFNEIKDVLRKFGQATGGSKIDLTDRAADIMVLGDIERCPRCKFGTLKFFVKHGTYYCPGWPDDHWYVKCQTDFSFSKIKRIPLTTDTAKTADTAEPVKTVDAAEPAKTTDTANTA